MTPRRASILIVEDDVPTRKLVETGLIHDHHCVVSCGTVAEAIEALDESGPFDVVLLDLNLPDESGLAVARRVRSGPCHAVRLICISGNIESLDSSEKALFSAFLSKPFSVRRLRSLVAE